MNIYVIVSFSFGHTLEVLEKIRMVLKEQNCESVGNFDLGAQAAQLSIDYLESSKAA